MPHQELSHRYQAAVLWPAGGFDEYGQPTVETATEIRVCWNTRRSQGRDSQGNKVNLDATADVGQEIAVGSILWLGALEDWVGTGSGGEESELHEVVTYEETPDLKNRAASRTVGLRRFRDQLPTST